MASLRTSVPGMPATGRSRCRLAALALTGALGIGLGLGAVPAQAEEPTTAAEAAQLVADGAHELEVRATDEAKNVGSAKVTITRTDPANAGRTARARVKFKAKAIGLRFRFSGRVLPQADGAFERPKGRIAVFMERRKNGKWNPPSRVRFPLNSKGRIRTYTSPVRMAGKWRVTAVFQAKAPYANQRLAPVVLKLK